VNLALLTSVQSKNIWGGGPEYDIASLSRTLNQLEHPVRVFAPVFKIKNRVIFNRWLKATFDDRPYDAVIGFDCDGFMWAEKRSVPFVVSPRSIFADEMKHEEGKLREKLKTLAHYERTNLHSADRVIVPSNYAKRRIYELYGVPEKKIGVVPYGIDIAKWSEDLASTPKESNDKIRILSVGRFFNRNKFDLLLRAFSKVRAKHPNCELRILGDGPLSKEIIKLWKKLKLGDAVTFHYTIENRTELAKEYKNADIFCSTTVQQTFPNEILDAMASGKPVVAMDSGPVPELVKDQVSGLLLPTEDEGALVEVLSLLVEDAELRNNLGSEGRKVAHSQTWEQAVSEYLKQLAVVINDPWFFQ